MNFQRWRHFAIAIARKHCSAQSIVDPQAADGAYLDHFLERQPGHTSDTRRQHYSRLENGISVEGDEKRKAFSVISIQWHRFLGIAPARLAKGSSIGHHFPTGARREAEEALQES